MEDRERVLITEAVLTVGALIVIKKMRDRKKQTKKLHEKENEVAALMRDLLIWSKIMGPYLTEDEFVTEYNDRVEFIRIVALS